MKRSALNLNSFFTRIRDGFISFAEIKDFVLIKFSGLNLKEIGDENILGELQRLKTNLITLGWIEKTKGVYDKKKIQDKILSLNAIDWINSLENGRVINHGIIAKDTGVNLDLLDESGEDLKGLTSKLIESLLKHVEVKRKKALKAFSQDLSTENIILEGLGISILFSRVARRHNDIRFLNTALKMNDWYYPIINSEHNGKLLIFYLLALTEQEITVMEMLQ